VTTAPATDPAVVVAGDALIDLTPTTSVHNSGTTLFYGVANEQDRIQVSPYEIFRRELTIKGSFAEIDSFPAALVALRSGRARTDGIITHRFTLEQYGDALEAVRGDSSAHKVVITP